MTAPAKDDHHAELIERAQRVEGGHLSIGCYRASLHYDDRYHLSGFKADAMKVRCIAAGLPVIDSRSVPYEGLWKLVASGPMIAVGCASDPPPWHGLSSAPLQAVADAYRAAGAGVFNVPIGVSGELTSQTDEPSNA